MRGELPKKEKLLTVKLTAREAQTLVASLAADIKQRTKHMHWSVQKRAAIETELKILQAVYDKVRAAHTMKGGAT
jgi:hypothetical protein